MFRVPGSKAKYFSVEYFRYFMYSQHLGFVYCGILLVLAVFQDYVLRILPYCHTRSIFWVRYSGILLYFKYFGVPYSGILVVVQHYPLSHSVSTY